MRRCRQPSSIPSCRRRCGGCRTAWAISATWPSPRHGLSTHPSSSLLQFAAVDNCSRYCHLCCLRSSCCRQRLLRWCVCTLCVRCWTYDSSRYRAIKPDGVALRPCGQMQSLFINILGCIWYYTARVGGISQGHTWLSSVCASSLHLHQNLLCALSAAWRITLHNSSGLPGKAQQVNPSVWA